MNTAQSIHIGSPGFYITFFVVVIMMILIDMFSLKKHGVHQVKFKEALMWSILWVLVSVCFALWLYFEIKGNPMYGPLVAKDKFLEFITCYVLEKSLSIDNIFVFLMIFNYFKVPAAYQHRVLLYGVLGAIIIRVLIIAAGAVLIEQFSWVLYVFGVFLIFTGIKMFKSDDDGEKDFSQHPILKWILKWLPVSKNYNFEYFFTEEKGKMMATPLLLVLLMVEFSDIVFAADSIPAVFAVTTDPLIVMTSNVFAILGLRALYFLLAGMMDRFKYLHYGLAIVLTFIGVKMLIEHWVEISIAFSLGFVFVTLLITGLVSFFYKRETVS